MISDTKSIFLSILSRLSQGGFCIGVGFVQSKPAYVHSTYSKDWEDIYVQRGFLMEDPTILHGQKELGHFTWSQLQELYPDTAVFKEARRFGMTEGNTLSLRIDGVRTIFSSAGRVWDEDEVKHAKAAVSAIHHLVGPDPYPVLLKPREMQVVDLMSQGCKDREISDRLGVKLETVRSRRQNCYEKTGTTSPASLVSFAVTNGWI